MDSLRRDVCHRDRREIIAGVLVIIIFGYMLVSSTSFLTQLGFGIIVLASGYIIYRLKSHQMEQEDDSPTVNLPLRNHLQHELEEVHRQYRLAKKP